MPPRSFSSRYTAGMPEFGGRYPAHDALAGYAGHAADAIESGKRNAEWFRSGYNKRLRNVFHTLADSTRHWHPS